MTKKGRGDSSITQSLCRRPANATAHSFHGSPRIRSLQTIYSIQTCETGTSPAAIHNGRRLQSHGLDNLAALSQIPHKVIIFVSKYRHLCCKVQFADGHLESTMACDTFQGETCAFFPPISPNCPPPQPYHTQVALKPAIWLTNTLSRTSHSLSPLVKQRHNHAVRILWT